MKKIAILVLILCLILFGCNESTTNITTSDETADQNATIQDNQNTEAEENSMNNNLDEEVKETLGGFEIPGNNPVIFAKDIVSQKFSKETTCSMAPNYTEFYFSRKSSEEGSSNPVIWVTRMINDSWSTPEKVSFASIHRDFNPFITLDNQYILFYRMEKYPDKDNRNGTWYSRRTDDGWSEPQFLVDEYCVTTSDFETFFYSVSDNGQPDNIKQFTLDNNNVSDKILLPGKVNSDSLDVHPVISPNGDFIIFDSLRPGGYTRGDMYVSFLLEDGTWSDAINLGEKINLGEHGQPSISPDGKYLFFASNEDIWWVSLDILDALKPF